jgi:putative DNA primase/helicase
MIAVNQCSHQALLYAELGYRVFPCVPGEKRPATSHGCRDATLDLDRVASWWNESPSANVGISTDGLLVLDVDGADNPWLSPELACELNAVAGAVSKTPRGGWHFWFRQPAGSDYRNTAGKIADKVDTRANGGYVVVPPSAVASGSYRWVPGHELDCPPESLPEPPPWLLRALTTSGMDRSTKATQTAADTHSGDGSGPIPEGKRNATLASIGGRLRQMGLDVPAIRAALAEVNNARCKPPLQYREVDQIANSVARYVPDQAATMAAEGLPVAESSLNLVRVSDVIEEPLKPLWPLRFYKGKLNLLCGDPGKGKSMLTACIAARYSRGRDWPDGAPAGGSGSVIFFSAEDDVADTILPRLRRADADLTRIYCMESMSVFNPRIGKMDRQSFALGEHVPMLAAKVKEIGDVGLIVIDPVSSYGGKVDSHKNGDVRTMLQPLTDLAAEFEIAVLAVTHLSKGSGGKAVYRATGSLAYAAASRAVWMLAEDYDDKTRRLLLPVKINIAKSVPGMAFTIEGGVDQTPYIRWDENPVEMTADEYLLGEAKRQESKTGDDSAQNRAVDFVKSQLADGPIPSKQLDVDARGNEISAAALRRAKGSLGCRFHKDKGPGGVWWTLLPEHTSADVDRRKEELAQIPCHQNVEQVEQVAQHTPQPPWLSRQEEGVT